MCKKNCKSVIFPGTFDPITNGHLDLLNRMSKIFDLIWLAIFSGSQKETLFSLEERIELAYKSTMHIPNVIVDGFNCLLVSFAKKKNTNLIVRGLRNMDDSVYEIKLARMNQFLLPKIEYIFFLSSEKYANISSSLAKEIALLGGDLEKILHPFVEKRTREKINLINKRIIF